ncbi:efflux RND transporter periplasmic adaptor subunit [Ramlibacter ginsenosidimutans]|uniref:Efflux RND transporter periplasmic adaptor subunit n=1 Tax=Ramlibacter ginsenosidimutans TaxID=502333 RepID=A0A934TWB4_9BURK|nr:efflux RND transporter periplasmic adaptor subunit [Ramlibacter ginsenosidimutans]MBK6008663.1 efflux RND transporter periplasmic adaptor subunit [Ramlibacter ginsenosidimutans]
MKTIHSLSLLAAAVLLAACAPKTPTPEALRPVRTVELHYDAAGETHRYVGTVRARHEVDEAFRVAGRVAQRRVEVGQLVHQGDVIGVIEDADYRLALDAAQQQAIAAASQARQAEADRNRLNALKADGSVSDSDDERARTAAQTSAANAQAQARQLELARNRLGYTVLRASRTGVVTSVRFEAGQVVAEGQPVVTIAAEGEPEIVVDVPEDQLADFRKAEYQATLASAPDQAFAVTLRELAPQAAAQTRTFQARLKPVSPRNLPLGATASVIVQQESGRSDVAAIPASAITQDHGKPAVWVARPGTGGASASVQLASVTVQSYRSDQVLVSGLPAGTLVVTAGVQKMAPGLHVALESAAAATEPKVAAR